MTDLLSKRLDALINAKAAPTLAGIRRGIEKESLRITPTGRLAQTPHPQALGSALTHPYLTTDYSEALLEFITPASDKLETPLAFLDDLHRYVYRHIGEERLWVNSMPCVMGADEDIPLAYYGTSNVGRMKYIYRMGLGHRYGRRMQTIAGIHYNMSFPDTFWALHQDQEGNTQPLQDFISSRYFDLTRNFQRYSWLLIYLFGASPAVCKSFLAGRQHDLAEHFSHTLTRPHATSLRMSDLGYQNNAQSELAISYNNLSEYVDTLTRAIKTEAPEYVRLGVQDEAGEYRQLNSNILQIENEYYSSIRPKRTIESGERPTQALSRRGVEYVEIRALDLNPFEPLGIDQEQIRFLDMFATYCLLRDAPLLETCDLSASKNNIRQVVYEGRNTATRLCDWGKKVSVHEWGSSILARMQPIAELFDRTHGGHDYSRSLAAQQGKLDTPDATPSARILDQLTSGPLSFFEFAMAQAEQHRAHFLETPLPPEKEAWLAQTAADSLVDQTEVEAADDKPFADYLAGYFRN
ncbi:MAG: glutamate--cysteine ligase [Alcanivorax sp.]|nr:glutamate--cysteine ligase [Alcanivorax sp.]